MKKDRNAFFNDFQSSNYGYYPQMPIQGGNMSSNYYNGPIPIGNNVNNIEQELETRVNKLERQINRLDNRVSELEQHQNYTIKDTGNNTGMYMI